MIIDTPDLDNLQRWAILRFPNSFAFGPFGAPNIFWRKLIKLDLIHYTYGFGENRIWLTRKGQDIKRTLQAKRGVD